MHFDVTNNGNETKETIKFTEGRLQVTFERGESSEIPKRRSLISVSALGTHGYGRCWTREAYLNNGASLASSSMPLFLGGGEG